MAHHHFWKSGFVSNAFFALVYATPFGIFSSRVVSAPVQPNPRLHVDHAHDSDGDDGDDDFRGLSSLPSPATPLLPVGLSSNSARSVFSSSQQAQAPPAPSVKEQPPSPFEALVASAAPQQPKHAAAPRLAPEPAPAHALSAGPNTEPLTSPSSALQRVSGLGLNESERLWSVPVCACTCVGYPLCLLLVTSPSFEQGESSTPGIADAASQSESASLADANARAAIARAADVDGTASGRDERIFSVCYLLSQ